MLCPSCQTPAEESSKFCKSCGALIPAEPGSAEDPLIGAVLSGKYRIVRLLGEGGMGAVYQGEQKLGTTLRRVAIKTLHKHLSGDATLKARFQRECGTMAGLDHPNTIQVFDFGSIETEEGEHLYIVMEFVEGENIADLLEKNGPMPASRALPILSQVCGSLAEAHASGIVHRDLKPENIVLTNRAGQKDFVKVLDFGIAKKSSDDDKKEQKLTQQGMVLGTPPYMSPEQFTGKPIDARSDIYSLGVVAYEMVTGAFPFKAETAWEWATQHMTVTPAPISEAPNGKFLPASMSAAIMRALAKNPDDRFESVEDFLHALRGDASSTEQSGSNTAGMSAAEPAVTGVLSSRDPHVNTHETRARTEVGTPIATPPEWSQGAPPSGQMGGPGSAPGVGHGVPSSPTPFSAPGGSSGGAPGGRHGAPASTPSHGLASSGATNSNGGGRGAIIAIVLLLVLGGSAAGGFALYKRSSGAGGKAGVDAGSSVSTLLANDAGEASDPAAFDAALPGLDEPDSGKSASDAGRRTNVAVDAGSKPATPATKIDAGQAPKTDPQECKFARNLPVGGPERAQYERMCREKGGKL